jgi:Holliday junction resolvasome RuvABC endonuclease subunit
MKNILSLDLSSKSSGWCVGDGEKIIDYGCITSASTSNIKRIIIMRDNITEINKKYDIKEIVIEEVRTDYKNAHTYKILTWLQGVIVTTAYEINAKINITYIQPSSWRAMIGIHTGRGIKREELKKADIAYVKNKYNIEANDDICDSICIYDAFIAKEPISDEINWE